MREAILRREKEAEDDETNAEEKKQGGTRFYMDTETDLAFLESRDKERLGLQGGEEKGEAKSEQERLLDDEEEWNRKKEKPRHMSGPFHCERRTAEAARKKVEKEAQREEENKRAAAEAEARKKAEEEKKRKAEEDRQTAEAARKKAAEDAQREEERKRVAAQEENGKEGLFKAKTMHETDPERDASEDSFDRGQVPDDDDAARAASLDPARANNKSASKKSFDPDRDPDDEQDLLGFDDEQRKDMEKGGAKSEHECSLGKEDNRMQTAHEDEDDDEEDPVLLELLAGQGGLLQDCGGVGWGAWGAEEDGREGGGIEGGDDEER